MSRARQWYQPLLKVLDASKKLQSTEGKPTLGRPCLRSKFGSSRNPSPQKAAALRRCWTLRALTCLARPLHLQPITLRPSCNYAPYSAASTSQSRLPASRRGGTSVAHVPDSEAIRSPSLLLPDVTHRTFDSLEPKALVKSNRRSIGDIYLEHHLLMVVLCCPTQTGAQNIPG